MQTIIETSAGQLYRVEETGDPDLEHVWYGVAVKRAKGGFVDKASARKELVRKAATRVVARIEPVEIVASFTKPADLAAHFGLAI